MLKVKILKKSKDSVYPEHIIVERRATSELAHLYFNNGRLEKFVHIVPVPPQKRGEKVTLKALPSYQVLNEFEMKNGVFVSLKGSEKKQSFYARVLSATAKKRALYFFDDNLNVAFTLKTDLAGKCTSDYFSSYNADVREIYPHMKRNTRHTIQNLNKNERN